MFLQAATMRSAESSSAVGGSPPLFPLVGKFCLDVRWNSEVANFDFFDHAPHLSRINDPSPKVMR